MRKITVALPKVYDMNGAPIPNVETLITGADSDKMELIIEGLGKRTLAQLREHIVAKQREVDNAAAKPSTEADAEPPASADVKTEAGRKSKK